MRSLFFRFLSCSAVAFGAGWLCLMLLWWPQAALAANQAVPESTQANILAATTVPLTDYFRESWTTRDGLPHNTINGIIQSQDGYLWFATWEGAARYDGRNFTVYGRNDIPGMPDSGMRALYIDYDGQLLIGGSRGGMARHQNGQWQTLPAIGTLINDIIRDSHRHLWIACEGGGLFIQTPDGRSQHFGAEDGLPPTVIYRLLQDKDGVIWLATQQGLYWINPLQKDATFQLVGPEQGMAVTSVFALAETADGTLLVGSEQGAYLKQGDSFQLLHSELANVAVSVLLVDQQQQIWLGTVHSGLMRLTSLGLEQLTVADGLPNNRVLALFQDREKSIWIGTNGGVFRLRDSPFTNLTIAKGLSDNYVRTLLEHSDGTAWVGTSYGLNRVQQAGKVSQVLLPDGKTVSSVLSLAEGPDGDVWVGTYAEGVLRFRQQQLVARYNRQNGLPANEVRAILPLADGSSWIGTAGGLVLLKADQMQQFHVPDGLAGEFITALSLQKNGLLWVGTGSGLSVRQEGKFRTLSIFELDKSDYVFDFYQIPDSDEIWFAADRGIARIEPGTLKLQLVGRAAGLPFDKVFAIVPQDREYFWLSTNRGVLRIKQQEALAVATGQAEQLLGYELYGESDGMLSAQANGGSSPAAMTRRNGTVWFATSQGVAMVDPSRLKEFAVRTPPVVVQKLSADGQQFQPEQASFAAGTRRIELQFAGLSYVMPTRIQYRTKLIGFDQDWVERGSQHVAEYTNLQPGSYQFLVSAAYPDGDWSAEPASIRFEIKPFFWQRPIFMLAVLLLLALTLVLLYRWRVRSLWHSEQRLRQQVQEKTAELQQHAVELRAAVADKTLLAEQLHQQATAFALQAREDGLTGLANRRAFDEQLAAEFTRAQRLQHQLCLVILDIDHFKAINDSWSHLVGDEVLKQLALVLKIFCREIDLAARWGGEEFALLLPQTSLAQGLEVCERLRQAIAALDFTATAPGLQVTASFGVAVNTGMPHYDKLISRADSLLYQAKAQGRNRVCG